MAYSRPSDAFCWLLAPQSMLGDGWHTNAGRQARRTGREANLPFSFLPLALLPACDLGRTFPGLHYIRPRVGSRSGHPAVRHLTLYAPWGAQQAPTRLWPLGVSGSSGVLRWEATGNPSWCKSSIPPERTETVGKWCSRNSSAALTERPSVFHTVTRGRPRWGRSSLSRPSSAGKGSKTAPSICPSAPVNSSGLRTSRTRG
jgi:hypothetical protein